MQAQTHRKTKRIFLPILVGCFLAVGSIPSVSWGAGDLTAQDSVAPATSTEAAPADSTGRVGAFGSLTLTSNNGVTVSGVQRTIQSGAINRSDEQPFSSSISGQQPAVSLSWQRDELNSFLNCDPDMSFYEQTDTITNEMLISYSLDYFNFLMPGKVMEVQVIIPEVENTGIDTTAPFPLSELNGDMTITLADGARITMPLLPDIPRPGAAAVHFGLLPMPVPLDDMVQMDIAFTGEVLPPLGRSQTVLSGCPFNDENLIGTQASGMTQLSLVNVSVGLAIYEPGATDADGDSIADDADWCPDSDMRLTVTVHDRNSGVENLLNPYGDGCTLADLIQEAFDAGGPEVLLELLADLEDDDILKMDEADAIAATPSAGNAGENEDVSTDERERLEQQAKFEAIDAEETREFAEQIREKAKQRHELADEARKRAQNATNQTVREVEAEAAKREKAEADRLDRLADDFDELADTQQEAAEGFEAKAEAEEQRLEEVRRHREEAARREAEERARAERERQTAEEKARKQREEAERRRNEEIDRQLERLNRQEKAKQEARARLASQPQTGAGQNTGQTTVTGSQPSGGNEPGSFPRSRVEDVIGATARATGSATRTTVGAVAGEVIGGALDIKTVIGIGNAVDEAAKAVPAIEAEAERGINQLANDPSRGDIEEARRALRTGFDRGKDIVIERLIK